MKMRKLLYTVKWRHFLMMSVSVLLLFATKAQQQQRRITGKVTGVNNKPVENASVVVQGKTGGTSTSASGEYAIDVQTGDILLISSVGFQSKEVIVGPDPVINVSLSAATGSMEEVIVVGYGKMKKTDVSSSQVSVTAEELQRTINPTFDQALQGRAANVYVSTHSGQPGAAPSVIIRGIGSLTGSTQPLYV